jgi:CheY-like chemotaxis protein
MSDYANYKVLIVDDDELNIEIVEEILADYYQIIKAQNGLEALSQLKKHRPALILLDVMMPVMDGYETCRRIKDNKHENEHVPKVILISAKASVDDRVQGYKAGADDYIVKPFEDNHLLSTVRNHIGLYEQSLSLSDSV